VILAGVLAIGYLGNVQYVKLFPAGNLSDVLADSMPFLPGQTAQGFSRGWLLDRAWHLALPIICLSYGHFAYLSKLSRGAVLENLRADYVRTARAKGVSEKDVLFRHVFSNSLIPLITVAAQLLPALIAGSVVVENIFSIQGMGKLFVDAINTRDRELFLSLALVMGLLGLVCYLLADILYAVVDPRVTYE
jgi:ABC-type dipeptide/oligopeptide/nickel transport system permease component